MKTFNLKDGGIAIISGWYGWMQSCTKTIDDVFFVYLSPNAKLHCGSRIVANGGEFGAFVLADRVFFGRKGEICCDGYIRQIIQFSKPREINNSGDIDVSYGSYPSTRKIRTFLQIRGAELITVPGGVSPICDFDEDDILVDAFGDTGTSYFKVPRRVAKECFPEIFN